jgi:hypothetical protein
MEEYNPNKLAEKYKRTESGKDDNGEQFQFSKEEINAFIFNHVH